MSRPLGRTTICTYSMSNPSYSELSRQTVLTRNNSSYPHKYVILFKSQHSYSTDYSSRICFLWMPTDSAENLFQLSQSCFQSWPVMVTATSTFNMKDQVFNRPNPITLIFLISFTNFFRRLSPVVPWVT